MHRLVLRTAGILVLILLAFAWSAPAQTPTLVPSTSQVALTGVANGPEPLSQIFTLAESDGSFVNLETLVDSGTDGSPAPAWITVGPHLAITPAQVQVAADTTGLTPGSYSARIQFTDLKGNSLGSPVVVTLQVTTAPAAFVISPSVVNLSGPISQGYLETGIFLRNTGPGTLAPVSVSVVSGYPWLSTIVPACDTSCAVTVKAAVASLPAGTQNGLLHVTTALGSEDVPVSLFNAAAGPFLQLTPQGLQFDTVENTGLVDSRAISLFNSGNAPANWSASIIAGSTWLSLDTASGVTAPGATTQITATMNSGFMPQGVSGGLIQISATDGSFNPIYVPVILRIEVENTPPVPLLSSAGIVFQTKVGAEGLQTPITLSGATPVSTEFQASAQSSGWLSAGPTRGELTGATPSPINVIETPIGLQTGFYSGLVNFAFGTGALRTFNVGLSVIDPAASCQPQFLYATQTALPDGFATRVGYPTPLEVVLVDDCGNYVSNALVNATFSNGDPDLELQPLGNGQYAATWMPANASDSLPNGVAAVSISGFAPSLPPASQELIGTVTSDTAPSLNPNAVLNNLNPVVGSPLAPGTIVQIYGSSLGTTAGGSIANGQLETSLNGTSVTIGGIAAPLFYTSAGQINAQIPNELQAGQQYQVYATVNGLYTNPLTITTTAVQPGLASFPDGTVIAQDTNYNLISSTNPAHPSEVIILYATGMGATSPPVPTGGVAPASPLSNVTAAPTVTIGTTNAQVLFAGLSPGSVGLYQIDIVIPPGTASGTMPLVVTQNGAASNTVMIPVE
ncbi:MAG TPA: IPT/TIG domain-containing protein [Bryobacteraceae bacterium]|nr:IPT/TIG domain-containing protein [Bryobacteraceae bacterium]